MSRSLRLLLAFALLFAAVGRAVPAYAADNKLDAIELVSPTVISIPLVNGQGALDVTYRVKKQLDRITISFTNAGRLPKTIFTPTIDDQTQKVIRSLRIEVDAKTPLNVGETFTGAILFEAGGLVDSVPINLVEQAPASFSVSPDKFDICVKCGDKPVLAIRVRNTGATPIAKLKISSVTLEDAVNHERVVYPNEDDKENPKNDSKTKAEPDVVEMRPGAEELVTIAPRASVTIHLQIAIPKRAGTYSGVIHVSANGADPAAVQLTLRTRGPNDWGVCPLVLFLSTLVVGAIAAKALEYWFGGGGGLIRARALFSLETSRKALMDLSAWLETLRAKVPKALPRTQSAIDRDLTDIGELFKSERNLKHGQIDERAGVFAERVAKRRALWNAAVRADGDAAKLEKLDSVPATGTLDAYKDALEAVLLGIAPEGPPSRTVPVAPSEWRLRFMRLLDAVLPYVRFAIWFIVVFATAYATFYENKCDFGSGGDYFTVFIWALGLTVAGSAVISEARSTYTPPARS